MGGNRRFTPLRTEEANEKLHKLLKDAEEAEKKYQEENSWRETMYDRNDEVDEMNRAFWRECGEGMLRWFPWYPGR